MMRYLHNQGVPNIDIYQTIATQKEQQLINIEKTLLQFAFQNGMKVTYSLTVYNEGEKAGRATKIT